jgi:pSer/pThr/pTyr-binding forkhead associated (FHA) protein
MTQQDDLVIEERSYLLGRTGVLAGHKIIIDRDYILIGRDPNCCNYPIRQAVISRRHAALETDMHGDVTITDLNSTNGTFVNGEPIKQRKLQDGDGINFGRDGTLSFIFYRSADSNKPRQENEQLVLATGILEEPLIKPVRQAVTNALGVITAPPVKVSESPSIYDAITTKQCPNCNEHIRLRAKYCMSCGCEVAG